MRHFSPAWIVVMSANLTLGYLTKEMLLPSVKTSKVRLMYGPCLADAHKTSTARNSFSNIIPRVFSVFKMMAQ